MAGTRQGSSRKRQTRLSFSPLPSSSPAKASQPAAVRHRAAAVTFDHSPSPSKRRRLNPLPTPAASSQKTESYKSPITRSTKSFMTSKRPPQHKILTISDDSDSEASATPSKPTQDFSGDSESDTPFDPSGRIRSKPIPPRPATPSDDSDVPVPSSSRRSKTLKAHRAVTPSSDDDEDVPTSAVKRRRLQRPQQDSDTDSEEAFEPPNHRAVDSNEEEDLQEDLDFLRNASPPRDSITTSASRQKSDRSRALDALRRRREQAKGASSPTQPVAAPDEDDAEDEFQEMDAGSEYDSQIQDPDDVDEREDDWLVDDEEGGGEGGVDGTSGVLPLEFTLAKSKPKELFKYVVEWMVHKKINPGFNSGDEVYRISFMKLDDYVAGMRNSKFESSIWTPQFIRSLRGRPILEDHRFASTMLLRDRCDACNRTGHPATWEVKFTGPTYNSQSLEEDSEEDTDGESEGYVEGVVPRADTTYYIGKTCMSKARTAHTLHHWKYHLNEWVQDWLESEGHMSADKIVARDSWSTKKRGKLSNRIVDGMEEHGEIKKLYHMFKEEVSRAQYQDDSRYRYDSD